MDVVFYFAYLDPGTGSLIIQSVIGAIAGIAVFGRRILMAIKMKFRGNKGKDAASPVASGTETTSKSDKSKK